MQNIHSHRGIISRSLIVDNLGGIDIGVRLHDGRQCVDAHRATASAGGHARGVRLRATAGGETGRQAALLENVDQMQRVQQ